MWKQTGLLFIMKELQSFKHGSMMLAKSQECFSFFTLLCTYNIYVYNEYDDFMKNLG